MERKPRGGTVAKGVLVGSANGVASGSAQVVATGAGEAAGDAIAPRPSGPVEAPDDLVRAMAAHPAAQAAWERQSPSHRREYVRWIDEARKPETRARRIAKTVDMLAAK